MVSLRKCVKMYYEDRYLLCHSTKIVEVRKLDRGYLIRPEEVIFFPGGGGQPRDTGLIEILKNDTKIVFDVEDIKEDDLGVYLIVYPSGVSSSNKESYTDSRKKESYSDDEMNNISDINDIALVDTLNGLNEYRNTIPEIGDIIVQRVDRFNRMDNMHQHTGQHLLSGCFYSLFERNTLSLHIGSEVSQLDIQGEFDDSMVKSVEDLANEIISRGIDILNYNLNSDNRLDFNTRRPLPDTEDPIRILEIPGIDVNACCGVHAKNTSHLRMIRIKRYYKHKGNTRFEYLVGDRAVNYVLNRDRLMDEINLMYSTSEENLKNALNNDKAKIYELIEEKKLIRTRLFDYMSKDILEKYSLDEELKIIDITEYGIDDFYDEFFSYLSDKVPAVLLYRYHVEDRFFIKLHISKTAAGKFGVDLSKDLRQVKQETGVKGGGNAISLTIFSDDKQEVDKFQKCIYHIYGE